MTRGQTVALAAAFALVALAGFALWSRQGAAIWMSAWTMLCG